MKLFAKLLLTLAVLVGLGVNVDAGRRASSYGQGTESISAGRRIAVPRDFPGCVVWLRADQGITLGGTPLAFGSSPPAVTISGALSQAIGIQIEITTGGARGTALFKWSVNSGSSYVATGVTTAATVNLVTSGGTIVAAFPSATYTNDNVYKATVASWLDKSGTGRLASVVQATAAAQPVFQSAPSGYNGKPGLSFTSGAQYLDGTFGTSLSQPATVVLVGHFAATTSNQVMMDGIDAGNRFLIYGHSATGFLSQYAGVELISSTLRPTAAAVMTFVFTGTSLFTLSSDTTLQSGSAGSSALTGITVGSQFTHAGGLTGGVVSDLFIFKNASAAKVRSSINKYASARYGVTLN